MANPEQFGDAKLKGPTGAASCTHNKNMLFYGVAGVTPFLLKNTMEETKKKKRFRFTIRAKTIIMIVLFAIVLAEIAMIYFSLVSSNSNTRTYKDKSRNLSSTIAEVIDAKRFHDLKEKVQAIESKSSYRPTTDEIDTYEYYDEYLAQFDSITQDPDYIYLRDYLRDLQAVNSEEVYCMYLVYIVEDLKANVYVVDNSYDDIWLPGTIDTLMNEHLQVLDNPDGGLPPSVTNLPQFGYLCTAGDPVYYEGQIVGYVVVDLSMTVIRAKQAESIVRLFLYLMFTVVVLSIVGIVVVNFTLNVPIQKLIKAAQSYDIDNPEKTHHIFENLNVGTHDEIQDLADAMKSLEHDIHIKINELRETNRQLVESQILATKMTELANRDGLTGVRNKISYDAETKKIDNAIKEGISLRLGIVMVDLNNLKTINDDYGHSSGDNAIIKLCNIICAIFAHSPVYRVGGDEFVVILRNVDFERSDKLIGFFNEKIEELRVDEYLTPAERITAAIGYAVFDPTKDKCVEDVFIRADHAMYTRKRQMKEEGKD